MSHALRLLRSIAAVFAGVLAVVILSLGTDVALSALGVFPPLGEPMSDSMLLFATVYRTVYAVAGGYIAARLAPDRPMRHALILGAGGLVMSIAGAVATWNKEPAIGHEWYPLALVVLALPPAWMGGRLREMQLGQLPAMRPRFTVRLLMAVVAIVGLAMAAAVMAGRSNEFRAMAEEQADSEQMSLAYADEGRGERGDPQRVARGEQMAAYHRALKIKYERATWYPWLPVESDPPIPEPGE
jgi:hypothetical protein